MYNRSDQGKGDLHRNKAQIKDGAVVRLGRLGSLSINEHPRYKSP